MQHKPRSPITAERDETALSADSFLRDAAAIPDLSVDEILTLSRLQPGDVVADRFAVGRHEQESAIARIIDYTRAIPMAADRRP